MKIWDFWSQEVLMLTTVRARFSECSLGSVGALCQIVNVDILSSQSTRPSLHPVSTKLTKSMIITVGYRLLLFWRSAEFKKIWHFEFFLKQDHMVWKFQNLTPILWFHPISAKRHEHIATFA